MTETTEKRRQWHPILLAGLEHLWAPQLEIWSEWTLGELPMRVDALLKKRDPSAELPYPYDHLGATTLLELVTPGKGATWRHFRKLWVYGGQYSLSENIKQMAGITHWLVASRVSDAFLRFVRREQGSLERLGPGAWGTKVCGSPFVIVDLEHLSLAIETLPLLMVYHGKRDRELEIAELAVAHAREHGVFFEQAVVFHTRVVLEVLEMKGTGIEAARGLANIKDIIEFFGERGLIEAIGEEKIIREIGEEKIIREIGEEKIITDLVDEIGLDRVRELVERASRGQGNNGTHER